jgi:ferredoxin
VSAADEIMARARSLFDVAGVARDPSSGDTVIVVGLVSTPERDLDDFAHDGTGSILRGFIRHAKGRLDDLLEFIREKGFSAGLVGELGYSPSGKPNLKHLAVAAGLGAQGKNTLVISPDFGPWLRFMAIRTDAPLETTGTAVYFREENPYCESCRKCVESCPVGILMPYRLTEAGRCLAAISGDRRGELAASPPSRETGAGSWPSARSVW